MGAAPRRLDVTDFDGDGDLDIVVGEHYLKNPETARLILFEDVDGRGSNWREHMLHIGDEHHDGAIAVDIDGDRDLDVVSIGWGQRTVLLFENLGRVSRFARDGSARPVSSMQAEF